MEAIPCDFCAYKETEHCLKPELLQDKITITVSSDVVCRGKGHRYYAQDCFLVFIMKIIGERAPRIKAVLKKEISHYFAYRANASRRGSSQDFDIIPLIELKEKMPNLLKVESVICKHKVANAFLVYARTLDERHGCKDVFYNIISSFLVVLNVMATL